MNRRRGWVLLGIGVCASISGCKSESATTPDAPELTANAVSATEVTGIVGRIAPFSPTIIVLDKHTQKPAANVPVHFTGGWVSAPETVTDANGIASAGEWRFSTKAGVESLSVSLGERVRLHFVATLTHDAPADFHVSDDGELVGLAGGRVAGFGVRLVDQFGNGVPGVALSFRVSSGALEGSRAVTGPGGGAYTGQWLLDETPRTSELTVTADGVTPKVLLGRGVDPLQVRWYKLKEYRTGSVVTPAPEPEIRQGRFGLTGMDACPCNMRAGFFIDEVTYQAAPPIVVQYGGRYTLQGTDLKLTEHNPSSEGAYLAGRVQGDELLIDRLHIIYLDDGFLPVDVVAVTWVYTRIVD